MFSYLSERFWRLFGWTKLSVSLTINPGDFSEQHITIIMWADKKFGMYDYWNLLYDVAGTALENMEGEEGDLVVGTYGSEDVCSDCRESCHSKCSCWCHGLKGNDENAYT